MLDTEKIGMKNLLKVIVFITGLASVGGLREVRIEAYGVHLPASSLVQVEHLFASDLKIKIEAIAALPNPSINIR